MSAPTTSERPPVPVIRYLDIVLVVLAAPIMLLIGVPASGYLVGAGVWIGLRLVGLAVEHAAGAAHDARTQISVRLGYMLGRLFALAMAIILVRQSSGRDAGLAALAVIVFAFTIQLGISALTRPRSR